MAHLSMKCVVKNFVMLDDRQYSQISKMEETQVEKDSGDETNRVASASVGETGFSLQDERKARRKLVHCLSSREEPTSPLQCR